MSKIIINLTCLFAFAAIGLGIGFVEAFAQSQASTGQITGVVLDTNGAVVPNATVGLVSKATNATQTATTSDEGIYRFVLLQPGTYTVRASASGFAEQTLDVEVQVGRTVDANFTLGAAGTSAEVTVTAEGVQSTISNFDAVQNETAIENLPINGRRFQDFVTLTPTAQVDPQRGQISLSGQRGINTNINVDGVDYNQPFFGGIRGGERSNQAFTIPQESIREFQVVAAGYSAEFGRSSGGIVNAVTKSGTNRLRGTAFYQIRPRQLARGNAFSDALREQRLSALGLDATLAPTLQQFGGSIGGPIVKDRLFFFGSYEQQRFRAPRQVLFGNLIGVTPTTTQTEAFNFYRSNEVPYTQTNDAYAALGRIDWNINQANRFNVRYNYSRNKALNAVSTGETALDPTTTNSLSTNGTERNRNNIVVAQLISNFSSNVVNEGRFQFAREDRPREANQVVANIASLIGTYGTRNFLPTTQFDKRAQLADSLTIINGNHSYKFGGEFSNIYANQVFGFNQTGVYTFSGLNTVTGVLDALSGTRVTGRLGRFDVSQARYNQQVGNLQAAYTVRELAFFGQDSWRITPKFTLNYGLRYEKQFNPTAQANNSPVLTAIQNTAFPYLGGKGINPAQIPNSQNQFGPRLGFAYDPFGDGKTAIRGFAGIYYARTPLIVLAAPFNNFRDPAGDLSVTLGPTAFSATGFNQALFEAQNPQYVSIVGGTGFTPNTVYRQFAILGINLNNSSLNNLPTLTPQQVQTITSALRAATTNPPSNFGVFQNASFIGITPNFKNPESYQFGGGFEREIVNNLVFGFDFSLVKTVFLERNTDINLPAPLSPSAYVDYLRSVNSPATFNALAAANNNFTDLLTAGRPIIAIATPGGLTTTGISNLITTRPRPLPSVGSIQLRDSSARSFYRSATFRLRYNSKRAQLNAFYTLSVSDSDDDNERDAGGILYDNPYDLRSEYGPSRLDRTHQFVANPIVFLPFGFNVSSAIRLRSGLPINAIVGTDLNGDGNSNERPLLVPGVEITRNAFRNRAVYDVDLRLQKSFRFGETRRVILSSEFFNIFNRANIQLSGAAVTNYCAANSPATPIIRCGLDGITNINFLQLRQQNPSSPLFNKLLLNNNPGSQVFQMQLGARIQF
jgi:outer membrane receptor for ferrienterochelin and colicin